MKRALRLLALAAALLLIAAACGDSSEDTTATTAASSGTEAPVPTQLPETVPSTELEPVRVQLQWFAQSQFCGYYAARDLGFYEEEGLDVTILEGGVDIVPQQVLASGGAEFGIAWVPKALVSNEGGAGIVNIAQPFQRSGTLMVSWADSGITQPADWAGKSVGNWGFGNEYELTAAIEAEGIADDVSLVQQDFTMTALLNRDIDAAEAMIYNEYAQLLEAENLDTGELYQPEDFNVIDFNDVGTAMLQDAIWVNGDWIGDAANQATAEAFLRGTFRGWIFCRDNPEEAVDIVLANGSTLGRSHQTWQLNEINGLIWPSPDGIGIMDQASWDQTVTVATSQIPELEGVTVPAESFRTDLAESAVAALEEAGLDTTGSGWTRVEVTLNPGGE